MDELEDPFVIQSIEFSDEVTTIHWYDKRDVNEFGTVFRQTVMSTSALKDSDQLKYDLSELLIGAAELLAHWQQERRANDTYAP